MKTPKDWKQTALPMQLTDIGWEQPEMFEQPDQALLDLMAETTWDRPVAEHEQEYLTQEESD